MNDQLLAAVQCLLRHEGAKLTCGVSDPEAERQSEGRQHPQLALVDKREIGR